MKKETNTKLTRRSFLKFTATSVATISVARLDTARFAHAQGTDIIKVGMIGCGGRCTGAAEDAMDADPGVRLVAMCDVLESRVQEKLQYLKQKRPNMVLVNQDHCFYGFDGYKHVIESSDVVLIANAAKFHPLHMLTAIEHGKHVFVEKPHGIDPAGIKLVNKACELAKQKRLCVVSGLHSRYHPGYRETINRIHEGAIGNIIAIEENFLRAPYGIYERQKGLSELQYQVSNQYHFNWLSGDDFVQSLVHNLDRASWAMNEEVPQKVHGMGGRSSMFGELYGNVFDHHAAVFEFANGVRLYAFCRTITGCYDESSSLVFGSKGKADILNMKIEGENNWHYSGPPANPYKIEHKELFSAIRSGNPINNGNYMAKSTLFAIMGQISCYTGKEITWDQISKSDFYYPPRPEECSLDMEPPVKPDANGNYSVFIPGKTNLI